MMLENTIHSFNRFAALFIKNITYSLWKNSNRNLLMNRLFKAYGFCSSTVLKLTPYEIVSHKTYCNLNHINCNLVETHRKGATSVVADDRNDGFRLIEADLPDLYYIRYSDLAIHGNSDFIIDNAGRQVINDYCAEMDSNRITFYDGSMLNMKNDMAILRYDGKKIDRKIDAAIMLSGKFSCNYYHVTFENLIRLLLIDRTDIPDDVPLIVDASIVRIPVFESILNRLNESRRMVLTIDSNEVVKVKSLYYLSPINRIVSNYIDLKHTKTDDIVFDKNYLLRLREKLLALRSDTDSPERIFISRKNASHRTYNEEEILDVLCTKGFAKVCPEQYPIGRQISLFNNAKYIVGGSGAAFTNILFCSADCRIVCLRSHCVNIPVFSTIACVLGVKMSYLSSAGNNYESVHNDYRIDPEEVEKLTGDL